MRGPNSKRTCRARNLRANETSAEEKLWFELRDRRLGGFKFVRQMPVGPYFADFACRSKRCIVEVDGATHGEPHEIAADLIRTRNLEARGYRVFRVFNSDVYTNLDGVLDQLLALLEGRADWHDI